MGGWGDLLVLQWTEQASKAPLLVKPATYQTGVADLFFICLFLLSVYGSSLQTKLSGFLYSGYSV